MTWKFVIQLLQRCWKRTRRVKKKGSGTPPLYHPDSFHSLYDKKLINIWSAPTALNVTHRRQRQQRAAIQKSTSSQEVSNSSSESSSSSSGDHSMTNQIDIERNNKTKIHVWVFKLKMKCCPIKIKN